MISFTKSSKEFVPQSLGPGSGAYTPMISPRLPAAPSFSLGFSPKENKYWDSKLYARSPGPVYKYSTDQEIAADSRQRKVVSARQDEYVT